MSNKQDICRYLVVLQHAMDDFPIQLCEDYQEAISIAKQTSWEPSDELLDTLNTSEATTPSLISVVGFDKQGKPTFREVVRNFDAE